MPTKKNSTTLTQCNKTNKANNSTNHSCPNHDLRDETIESGENCNK